MPVSMLALYLSSVLTSARLVTNRMHSFSVDEERGVHLAHEDKTSLACCTNDVLLVLALLSCRREATGYITGNWS